MNAFKKHVHKITLLMAGLFVIGGLSMTAAGLNSHNHADEHDVADTYSVVIMVAPAEGGEVEGAGEYHPGEEVVLEAEPNEGYEFLQWTDNIQGFVVGSDEEYTFEMPEEDVHLTAQFVEAME